MGRHKYYTIHPGQWHLAWHICHCGTHHWGRADKKCYEVWVSAAELVNTVLKELILAQTIYITAALLIAISHLKTVIYARETGTDFDLGN